MRATRPYCAPTCGTDVPPNHVDVVVVGAGSCGCVVAAHLSDAPARSVLLLEAGPGFDADVPHEIEDVTTLPVGPLSPWAASYRANPTPQRTTMISRGRTLGGSGSVNGAYFVRARPGDFEAWPQSWSYRDVLPFFKAVETDTDFGGDEHGDRGPIPVSRTPRERMHPVSAGFDDAARALGYPAVEDLNAPGAHPSVGVGRVPLNAHNGIRVSTYLAFLRPVRHRPNLAVRTGTRVERVVVENGRAVGVDIRDGSAVHRIHADEVVLCAGAIGSAHLLMLSGIGPGEDLHAAGIDVECDLPGVGANFTDHPEVTVPYGYRDALPQRAPVLEMVLHTEHTEIRPYTAPFDVSVPGSGALDPVLGVVLTTPRSRGRLVLDHTDPRRDPHLDYRYLQDETDRDPMRDGVRIAVDLLRNMETVVDPRRIDPRFRTPVPDDALLFANLGTSQHLSGTCRMGSDGDTVVDESCRVHGIENLRVVDTSVFPAVPSRGPHATAVMLAYRVSHGRAPETPENT